MGHKKDKPSKGKGKSNKIFNELSSPETIAKSRQIESEHIDKNGPQENLGNSKDQSPAMTRKELRKQKLKDRLKKESIIIKEKVHSIYENKIKLMREEQI